MRVNEGFATEQTKTAAPGMVRFRVSDMTGREYDAEFQRSATAGAVAQTLAERLMLPLNTPWALRNDRSAYLDEDRPIGDQIESDQERLGITPKSHLGAIMS